MVGSWKLEVNFYTLLSNTLTLKPRNNKHPESQLLFKFKNISRLAFKDFTDRFKGIEADAFGFTCFQDRKVNGCDTQFFCQFFTLHFSFGKHYI